MPRWRTSRARASRTIDILPWLLVFAATLAAAEVCDAQAREIRCDYAQRIECAASGCAAAAVEGRYLLLPSAEALARATSSAKDAAGLPAIKVCDRRGCTSIAVRAVRGGAFLNVAQDGGAHFLKIALRDMSARGHGEPGIRKGAFVEVAAQFLSTVTHVGACPALVP
jgi:hypothetical protein